MKKLRLEIRQSYSNCGDGCCDMYHSDFRIIDEHSGSVIVDIDNDYDAEEAICAFKTNPILQKLGEHLGFEVVVDDVDTTAEDEAAHQAYMEAFNR